MKRIIVVFLALFSIVVLSKQSLAISMHYNWYQDNTTNVSDLLISDQIKLFDHHSTRVESMFQRFESIIDTFQEKHSIDFPFIFSKYKISHRVDDFDKNVTPVPEPATILLLSLGIGLIGFSKRKAK